MIKKQQSHTRRQFIQALACMSGSALVGSSLGALTAQFHQSAEIKKALEPFKNTESLDEDMINQAVLDLYNVNHSRPLSAEEKAEIADALLNRYSRSDFRMAGITTASVAAGLGAAYLVSQQNDPMPDARTVDQPAASKPPPSPAAE